MYLFVKTNAKNECFLYSYNKINVLHVWLAMVVRIR